MENITVKAVNPDNELELKSLIGLLAQAYGDKLPVPGIYDTRYWRSHIGPRFMSIVALHEGEMVGHIAVEPDPANPRVVGLLFPAADPRLTELVPDITSRTWQHLMRHAERRNWRMFYSFVIPHFQVSRAFTDTILGGTEVALLSNCLPHLKGRSRCDLLMATRFLTKHDDPIINLYVPSEHVEFCRSLYEPLGLRRTFSTSYEQQNGGAPALPADAPAIEKKVFKSIGIARIMIQPSLLIKNRISSFDPSPKGVQATYVMVNAEDPACPYVCRLLANGGYRLSGIIPLLNGRDNLVYTKTTEPWDSVQELGNGRARMLQNYVGHSNFNQAVAHLFPNPTSLAASDN